MKVVLKPGGRELDASAQEPLLDALLRAGVSVRYQCNNGSCGRCRAQLVQGELQACRHGDYVLSQRDKQQNTFLLCTHAPLGDVVLSVPETDRADDIPRQVIDAKIQKLEPLTDETVLVLVRTPRSKTLWFLAGQSVELEITGAPPLRAAVASCPCNGMQLQFHLRNSPEHRAFFESLRPKQDIRITGPVGSFVLNEDVVAPLLFVAWDTGFAAAKSIIEHLIALEWPAPVRLLRAAGLQADHYLENHSRSWVMALDDYAHETLVVAAPEAAQVLTTRAQQLCAGIEDGRPWHCYLSGPDSIMEPVAAVLQQQPTVIYRNQC